MQLPPGGTAAQAVQSYVATVASAAPSGEHATMAVQVARGAERDGCVEEFVFDDGQVKLVW